MESSVRCLRCIYIRYFPVMLNFEILGLFCIVMKFCKMFPKWQTLAKYYKI